MAMKYPASTLLVLVTGLRVVAGSVPAGAGRDAGASDAALSESLSSPSLSVRLSAIEQLGMVAGSGVTAALVAHLQSLPPGSPSTEPRQPEKAALVRVLAERLDPTAFQVAIVPALETELDGLVEARRTGQDAYYPRDLLRTTLGSLRGMEPSGRLLSVLNRCHANTDLPVDVRAQAGALLTVHTLETGGATSVRAKALHVLSTMDPPPTAPIPWEIYLDPGRRQAYGAGQDMKERLGAVARWRSSDAGLRTQVGEEVLSILGPEGVAVVLDGVEDGRWGRAKQDYLVALACGTLRRLLDVGARDPGPVSKLAARAAVHVDRMLDDGAFGWRARASADLDAVFGKLGIERRMRVAPPAVAPDSNPRPDQALPSDEAPPKGSTGEAMLPPAQPKEPD